MNHIAKTIRNSSKNTEIQQRIIGMHKKNIENPPLLPVSKAPNVMKISLNPPQTIRNGPWNNDNSDFCGKKCFAIPLTSSPCSLCPDVQIQNQKSHEHNI